MPTKRKPKRRPPPTTRRVVDVLTLDEVTALLHRCSRRASTGLRNRALLALLYSGALRIGEALALRLEDFDHDASKVLVRAGKGGVDRRVALPRVAADVVQVWIDRRNKRRMRAPTLICTLAGGELAPQYVAALLKRLAREAGIAKRVHPHALRHSRALHLAQRSPVNFVQAQLGHRDLRTTTRYLAHVTGEDLSAAAEAVPWPPAPPRRSRARSIVAGASA